MSSLLKSRWAQLPATEITTTTQTASNERPAASSTLSAAASDFSPAPTKTVKIERPVEEVKETKPESVKESNATPAETSAKDEASTDAAGTAPAITAYPVDEFAQTGYQDDDLFDDDITYETIETRPQDDLFGDEIIPVTAEEVSATPAASREQASEQRPRTETRGRGRGRGRGGLSRNSTKEAEQDSAKTVPSQAPENAPTGPKKETQPAVRGDRQATGGIKKPKLSEAELSEKMAQISIKNASLTAAHARAEADAASFEQREAQAKVDAAHRSEAAKARAKEERRDRQQMIGEREKNRQRKLKAMDGREWDAEKNEDDFSKGGRFDRKGGFVGDQQDYTDGREYLLREPRSNGAARGGRRADAKPRTTVPGKEDFPALPTANESTGLSKANMEGVRSWADQVESSAG